MAPFLYHIPDIIVVGSKEKMVGINTCRGVAFMKNENAVRYIPVVQFPRKPMSAALDFSSMRFIAKGAVALVPL